MEIVKLEDNYINLDNWYNLWNFIAYKDHIECYKALIRIGIQISYDEAFKYFEYFYLLDLVKLLI